MDIRTSPTRETMMSILPASKGSIVAHVFNDFSYSQFIGHYSANGEMLKQFDISTGSLSLVGMLAPEFVLIAQQADTK